MFDGAEQKVGSAHLLFLAIVNETQLPRMGLVIAKKKLKRAVDRNFVKRSLRESFRLHQHQLPALDIVVVARTGLTELSSGELRQEIDSNFDRLIRRCRRDASKILPTKNPMG